MRLALAGALLLGCAGVAGCQVVASSAVTVGLEVVVKAFEIDSAIINDIRAHRDAMADPQMKGVLPERMAK